MDHWCERIEDFPIDKFHQKGVGKGNKVLLIGESPAANGWRKSGKACYTPEGKLLPTGKRLNELLSKFELSVDTCGFTELAKCFVGKNRKQLLACSRKCWPIFLKQIATANYKLLIVLGVETLRIFNLISGLNMQTGKLEQIELNSKQYWVLGIYHPSPINPIGQAKNREIFDRINSVDFGFD